MKTINPLHNFTFNGTVTNVYSGNPEEGLPRHEHTVPHITFVTSGKTVVRKEGKELIMTPESKPVLLTENEWHEIEILESNTTFVNII